MPKPPKKAAAQQPVVIKKIPKEIQRRLDSLKATRARPREYREEYGEEPTVFSTERTKKIVNRNQANPYFVKTITGIDGRLSEIVRSEEFQAALAGMSLEELRSIGPNDLLAQNKLADADEMIGKLRWSLTALGGTHNGFLEDRAESTRQTAHFGTLLKRTMPNGIRVYDALKTAAEQIAIDQPGRYVPKSKQPKENEINTAENAISELDEDLIRNPESKKPQPPSMANDLMTDLYHLDEMLELGLNMPKLDPQSVRKEPDISKAKSWAQCSQLLEGPLPCDPKARQDRLAKMLIATFESKRRELAIARGELPPKDDFSKKKLDSILTRFKKLPVFKQIIKDPTKVRELLTPGPKRQAKQFNTMINVFRPFASLDEKQSKLVLGKLQGMLQHMDPPNGRSKEWKALIASIKSIDMKDPLLDPEQKLQEIYDKSCAYMKGKKSLRDDYDKQNRFDQALDVLSVLGETGEYAKMAAQDVVDRINEVRTGHDERYDPINLKQYGAGHIIEHSNAPRKTYNALDVLPAAKALPVMPDELEENYKPLHDYTPYVSPLHSKGEVSLPDMNLAIATVIALSKRQAYFFPDRKRVNDSDLREHFKVKGSAVIQDKMPDNKNKMVDLDTELFSLQTDPAVKALTRKYMNPEARQELIKELPPEEKKSSVKWADQERNRQAEEQKNIVNEPDRQEAPDKAEEKHVKHAERKTVYRIYPQKAPNYKDPKNPEGEQRGHSWKAAYGQDNYDPRQLNVSKLLEEYQQVKRELANAGPQLDL